MPRKKNLASKPQPSKTAFVLSLPRSLAARDVVARAKASGIGITTSHVYVIRSKAKVGGKRTVRRGRPRKIAARPSAGSTSELAAQFLEAAVDLGLARAEELLRLVRARVTRAVE